MFKFAKFLSNFLIVFAAIIISGTMFLAGFSRGFVEGKNYQNNLSQNISSTNHPAATLPAPSPKTNVIYITPKPSASWGGPQLWDAVNKARVANGVNALSVREEICTIASIRLNELLDLGKLDGHAGFTSMPSSRPDLKWIFDKYNLSEFLVMGATSPQNAVDLWYNTLGHKELITGGQYVWGCIYAQNGFGVAIAAY